MLLGTDLKDGDRLVIIEDVTTSGKSIDETIPIVQAQAKVKRGLGISVRSSYMRHVILAFVAFVPALGVLLCCTVQLE